MVRLFTILLTLWGILVLPAVDAYAFWLSADNQCQTDSPTTTLESADADFTELREEDCASVTDPSDS